MRAPRKCLYQNHIVDIIWNSVCCIASILYGVLLFSVSCNAQAESKKYTAREVTAHGETEQKRVSARDLRAFCPPIDFAEEADSHTVYGGRGAAKKVAYQAALTDITRDCRYDNAKGVIEVHIAAAGKVVTGSAMGNRRLSLPLRVIIADDDERPLLQKTYTQNIALQQVNAATQFLFSEKLALDKTEIGTGAKITIGFAGALKEAEAREKATAQNLQAAALKPKTAERNQTERDQNRQPKPRAGGGLSSKKGDIMIPESF